MFAFLLLGTSLAAAASYSNTSSINAAATSEDQYLSSVRAKDFVDCSNYTSSDLSASPTITGSSSPASSASIAASAVPFEEYWCENWADQLANTPDSYPNHGDLEGYFYGLNASAKAFCLSLEAANYSSWLSDPPPPTTIGTFVQSVAWEPTLTQPCCDTFCNIYASAAQLLYWPTPAPVPAVTTVVSDGYTFTSPSVYIVYQGISAVGQCGNVGPTYAKLTQSYAASDISTVPPGQGDGAVSLDFAQLYTNCTSRAATYSNSDEPVAPCLTAADAPHTGIPPSCQSQIDSISASYFADQIHCYPNIQFPPGLQTVDPEWAPCDTLPYGGHFAFVFDPPRALRPAPNLGPDSSQIPEVAASATPAASIPPAGPQQTNPPSTPSIANVDPGNTNTVQPKPSDDPQPNNPQPDPSPIESAFAASSEGAQAAPGGTPATPDPGQQSPVDPAASNPASSEGASPRPLDDTPAVHPANSDPEGVVTPSKTTIQGHTIQAAPSPNAVIVDGQSIVAGADPTAVSGTPVALQSNGDLVLGTSTVKNILPNPAPSQRPAPIITAAGQPATVLANGVAIAGTTLTPNAPAITISGQPLALVSNGLVVGTSTIPLPTPIQNSIFTAAGLPATALANGVAIAGTTLTPNAPAITIAGTPISLGSNGLVAGTSTINLPSSASPQVITAAGQLATILPSGVAVAGTTLTPGAPAITIAGTPISLASNALVVGTSTIAFPTQQLAPSSVTVGGQTVPINPVANGLVIAGTTLQPNQPAITISGTIISLASNGLVVGSSTIALPTQASFTSSITLGGSVIPITQVSDGVIVAGQTLQIGQPTVTIDGTAVALESAGLVVGTSTIPFETSLGSSPTSGGLGGLILSGLNGGVVAATGTGLAGTNGTVPFIGGVGRVRLEWRILAGILSCVIILSI